MDAKTMLSLVAVIACFTDQITATTPAEATTSTTVGEDTTAGTAATTDATSATEAATLPTGSTSPEGGTATTEVNSATNTVTGTPGAGSTIHATTSRYTTAIPNSGGTDAQTTTAAGSEKTTAAEAGGTETSGTAAAATTATDGPTGEAGTTAANVGEGTGATTAATQANTAGANTAATPKVPKTFECNMRITEIGNGQANFTEDLANSSSAAFKELSEKVCTAVTAATNESSLAVTGCTVTEFKSGSVVAVYQLEFPPESSVTSTVLLEKIKEAFANSTDPLIKQFGVDLESIMVVEILPTTQAPVITTGSSTVTPTEGQPASTDGLSPGAIAGIVVGAVLLALILMVVVVFVVMKMKGSGAKVASEDTNPQPASHHE